MSAIRNILKKRLLISSIIYSPFNTYYPTSGYLKTARHIGNSTARLFQVAFPYQVTRR